MRATGKTDDTGTLTATTLAAQPAGRRLVHHRGARWLSDAPSPAGPAGRPWAAAVAVLGAGTYLVVDALPSQAATSGLRTATVATGSVTQSTSLSGSVERVDQVTAAFRTAGTVTSVKVAVGDEVEAGDVLATMDTADLDPCGHRRPGEPRCGTGRSRRRRLEQQLVLHLDRLLVDLRRRLRLGSTTSAGAGSGSAPDAVLASPSPSAPAKGVDTPAVHRAVDDFDALVQAAVTTCQPVDRRRHPARPRPDPHPDADARPQ